MRAVTYVHCTPVLSLSPIHSFAAEEVEAFVNQSAAVLSQLSDLNTTLVVNGNNNLSIWIPLPCRFGPQRIVHIEGDIFHWPLIIKDTCNWLYCPHPTSCIPLLQGFRTTIRRAYRILFINPLTVQFLGYKRVKYTDHIICQCRNCNDIIWP